MSPPRLTLLPLLLLLAVATNASAQRVVSAPAAPSASSRNLDQTFYKGVVGNVLDAIPMDPLRRVNLQRANAIVTNTASGRSLAVLAGLSNPVLMIVGLVWGAWSASNIKPLEAEMKLAADEGQSDDSTVSHAPLAALVISSIAVDNASAKTDYEPILVSSIAIGNAGEAVLIHAPVIKIWLPQRSAMLSQ